MRKYSFTRKLALDTARAGVIARGAQTNGAVALYHKSSVPPPAIWRLRSHWAAVSSLPNNLEVWVAVLMTILAPWINLHRARWACGGGVFSLRAGR